MAGGVIPPVMANDDEPVREELDPFDPGEPVEASDAMGTVFELIEPGVPKNEVPLIPSSALDPMPPTLMEMDNGEPMPLDVAKTKAYYMQRDLARAAEPLLKSLGPSFEKLSTFGYSEPTTDPGATQLQPMLRKLVRNL